MIHPLSSVELIEQYEADVNTQCLHILLPSKLLEPQLGLKL